MTKGSRNAAPPRVDLDRATAPQEQQPPSGARPEEEEEKVSALSSSEPQPQPQGQPRGVVADLAATTAPAAAVAVTSTTTTTAAAAAATHTSLDEDNTMGVSVAPSISWNAAPSLVELITPQLPEEKEEVPLPSSSQQQQQGKLSFEADLAATTAAAATAAATAIASSRDEDTTGLVSVSASISSTSRKSHRPATTGSRNSTSGRKRSGRAAWTTVEHGEGGPRQKRRKEPGPPTVMRPRIVRSHSAATTSSSALSTRTSKTKGTTTSTATPEATPSGKKKTGNTTTTATKKQKNGTTQAAAAAAIVKACQPERDLAKLSQAVANAEAAAGLIANKAVAVAAVSVISTTTTASSAAPQRRNHKRKRSSPTSATTTTPAYGPKFKTQIEEPFDSFVERHDYDPADSTTSSLLPLPQPLLLRKLAPPSSSLTASKSSSTLRYSSLISLCSSQELHSQSYAQEEKGEHEHRPQPTTEEDHATHKPVVSRSSFSSRHEDARAVASTTSMNYCAADLIPLSGIMSNDSPLPDIVLSNAKDEIYIMDQPIESFHYKHQASSKSTVRPPITVSCDELQFLRDQQEKMVKDENLEEEVDIDHHYAIDVPDLIIKKKKYNRKIVHNKLDNYFANPDLFFQGNCNGDYPDLKMAADPNDTSGITLLDGSRVPQEIIDNVFLPGAFMSHITSACNLKNSPRDRTRFYDSSEHGALEGGILQHGLKRFTTIEGHKEESHINGVWMLPGSRIKSGIQHVCKNHNKDLMYSNNKVGVVMCRKDDPELKKLRPFPLCTTWAREIHPAYSLENMEVNPEFIFIVDTQNIPQFFDHILGHPDLIDLQTQEQKKETRQKYYHEGGGKEVRQKYYHEGGGKETQQKWYNEGGGKEAQQKWYHEGGGKETQQKYYHEGGGKETRQKWYHEGGGKEYKQQWFQKYKKAAPAKSFNKFSISGVLPTPLQCDCGKKFKSESDYRFQNHIAACRYVKKGFRSSQQLLIKSLGMSATSCKEDHILWLKLRTTWSALKAMNLPLSVSDFIVNLFNNARQQERVDRLKKMIECEKMRKESAQDKASIANMESVITEIELQQENNENPPTLVFDDIPSVGYNPKKLVEEPDVPSDKYLRKVLRKNNLPTDGIRTTLLGRLNDHNKSKKPHTYADYW